MVLASNPRFPTFWSFVELLMNFGAGITWDTKSNVYPLICSLFGTLTNAMGMLKKLQIPCLLMAHDFIVSSDNKFFIQ